MVRAINYPKSLKPEALPGTKIALQFHAKRAHTLSVFNLGTAILIYEMLYMFPKSVLILYLAHVVPDARFKDVSVGKQDYHVQAYVDVEKV